MAEHGPYLVDFTITNRPPSGKLQNVCSRGFQYRGKMFSGFCGKNDEKIEQKVHNENNNNRNFRPQKTNAYIEGDTLHRNIQSAKGRLEMHTKDKELKRTKHGFHSSNCNTKCDKSTKSIIDLNVASDVPDYEEQMLLNAATKTAGASTQTTQLLNAVAIRPSSAKGSLGSPVVKVDDENQPEVSKNIKPSVYGLRVGRQVYGSEPEVMEAWKNVEKEFPYKLADHDASRKKDNSSNSEPSLPSTLKPLSPWLQERVPSAIIGLDPSSCLVFLSHDYENTDLPEVPAPQDPMDYLPYKCVVETPREPVVKTYKYTTNDKEDVENDWKCKHSMVHRPSYTGDISNLVEKPYIRSPEKIRKEIQELEDLMHGIGSLASNCSFVQFQAEIIQAKELAAKLYKLRPKHEDKEPTDTFGLLKIYKDHEHILEALQRRRNDCIQELALLERNM